MNTKQVGTKLVELCRNGKNLDAISALYSRDVVSVEAAANPAMPREMRGIDQIIGKNKWWEENHEIHSGTVEGPFPHDDRFAVKFNYDITPKSGPMNGKRMQMNEVAIYTVKDGKIVREEFFYDM